jgi:hypothetical protein
VCQAGVRKLWKRQKRSDANFAAARSHARTPGVDALHMQFAVFYIQHSADAA